MGDELKDWWDEDAERLNQMAEKAKKKKVIIKVGKKVPKQESLPKVFNKLEKKD